MERHRIQLQPQSYYGIASVNSRGGIISQFANSELASATRYYDLNLYKRTVELLKNDGNSWQVFLLVALN